MTTRHAAPTAPPPSSRPEAHARAWRAVAGIEVALAVAAVAFDLFVPSLLVAALAVVSLLVRRRGVGTLGLCRAAHPARLVGQALALAAVWSLVAVGVTKPLLWHVAHERQDMSAFEDLQGDVGMLLALLVLSWALAAFVEELAFRGFVQTRMTELLGAGAVTLPLSVLLTSVLFGLLHTEYAAVGVLVSTVDAVFYTVLRYRYRTLWAPILTHGFVDTIGIVTVFLVGPVYGLW